jgi:agmatinase
MTLCDAGDVFTIPANLEKSFDQITRGVAHVFSSGALPIMLGGDHSIGFPCVRGIAQCTDKKIGIIHFDRHIDIQEKDLDERMHTTPWFWATSLPNVPAVNLVQLGIGGWQVPREGVQVARQRNTNVLTIADIERFGIEKSAEIALELAWKGADAVYISFDVDSLDCGFVPGTGWPEPGGFLPREALKLLGLVCAQGICGFEVVEVSPPYDTSDITALMGVRVVVEALGSLVAHGKLGSHKSIINTITAIRTTMVITTTMVATLTRIPMPRRMRIIMTMVDPDTIAARSVPRRSGRRPTARTANPSRSSSPISTKSRPPSSTASSMPRIRSASSGCHGSLSNSPPVTAPNSISCASRSTRSPMSAA